MFEIDSYKPVKTLIKHECFQDMSSEEDEATEVESFMLDQEIERTESLNCGPIDEADLRSVDPETHARLEALLDAAGIGKLSTADGKALTDPEVLRKLTSSVSCALDEAAAALTRMRAEQQAQIGGSGDTGRTLVEACSDGDVKTVRNMLIEGGNVHETTEEGESLLSLACSAGYYELAQVLLTMQANVEDRGVKGDCTPLMEAASGGYIDIVRLLITHGADVNAHSSAGNTPLHYAAAGGFVDIVELLLSCKANVEEHNENGHTPLMEAASAGHVPVAKALLDAGAGINTHSNEFKESALTLACYKGHLEMVKFLLDQGADHEHKTDEMHTALMEASMDGHVNVARLLLDSGAQVNMPPDSFESPLTLAACGGHAELATLLIERGANLEEVNDEGYTPLMEAAREGHEEMVAILLAHGAEINAQTEETQETALTLACCGGFLEVAEFLIKVGADVELGCSTPLMEASQEGHIDLVKFLIHDAKAKVNATTATGDSALTYACENGHTDVAEVLLDAGAVLDHESEGGRTPLMKSARAGHYNNVQFLIARGSNVNKQTTTNDHTVLSLACAGGHLSVVELLLSHGASMTHKLKDGSTMIIEASKGGYHPVVNLLLNWTNRLLMSPEMSQAALPDSQCNEQRVPFSGLANYVPPSEPDSSTNPALYPVPKPGKPNVVKRKEKSKSINLGSNGDIPADLNNLSVNYATTKANLLPQSTIAMTTQSAMPIACHQPMNNMPGTQLVSTVQAASNDGVIKNGGEDISSLTNEDFRASERLDAIFSSMVKDLILNMSGSPEEQMIQRQQVIEELQKVERELREKAQFSAAQNKKPTKEDQIDTAHLHAIEHQLQYMQNMQGTKEELKDNAYPQYSISQIQRFLQLAHSARTADKSGRPLDPADNLVDLEMIVRAQMREEGYNVSSEAVPSLSNNNNVMDFNPDAFLDTDNLLDQNYSVPIDNVVDTNLLMDSEDMNMNLLSEISNNFSGLSLPVVPPVQHVMSGVGQGDTRNVPPHTHNTGSVPGIMSDKPMSLPQTLQPIPPPPPSLANTIQYTPTIADILSSKQPYTSLTQSDAIYSHPSQQALTVKQREQLIQQFQRHQLAQQQPFANLLQQWKQQQFIDSDIDTLARHFTEKTQLPITAPNPLDIETPMTPAMPLTPNPSPASPDNWLYPTIDLDAQTESNHDTALTLACAGGHIELVVLLLTKNADIEHRDKKGFTPLILAATAGHVEVVEILLDHGADIEAQSERTKDTPLSLACSGGRFEVVELLLARGANKEHRNVSDYTPLSLAASGGYVNIIKHLLTHGAEINSRTGSKLGISPLMLAAMNGHTAAVKLLLDMGSDINAQIETNRNTALTLACFQGRHEVVSLLVDRKAMIEHRAKTGLTPLMEAASGGYVEVGRVLLDKGADVNASPVPSSRDTALTIAADKGHYRFVELLLSRHASVDVKNKKGDSPLWLACNGGHLDVVQQLVSSKANIDSQDNRKVSCLMAAFRKGHVTLVKWMVKHVTQFPSDQECSRYILTITELELQQKCQECMNIIEIAKAQQAAEANKNASILLEELDMEKKSEELKKAAQERRRQKRKKKRKEKQKGKGTDEMLKTSSPEPEDEDDLLEEDTVTEKETQPVNIEPPSATTISTLGTSLVTYTSVEARNKRNRGVAINKVNQKSHDIMATVIQTSVLTTISNPLPRVTPANTNTPAVTKLATANRAETQKANVIRSRREKPKERLERNQVQSTTQPSTTTTTTINYVTHRKNETNHGPLSQSTIRMNGEIPSSNARRKKDFSDIRTTKITAISDLDDFGTIPDGGKLSDKEFAKITKNSMNKHSYGSSHGQSHAVYRNDHSLTNGPSQPANTKSPHGSSKRSNQRKEDGWKEVVRKCKKVTVPSTAISRVIGRGGCNINTIRDASGAHIEVEKQRGTSDRLVTIRGSVETTRQAHMLIMALVNEPDRELTEIVPEVLSMTVSQSLTNGPTTVTSSYTSSSYTTTKSVVVSSKSTTPLKASLLPTIGTYINVTTSARMEKITVPSNVWNNAQAQQSSFTIAASPKKVLMKAQQSIAGASGPVFSGGSLDNTLTHTSLSTNTAVTFSTGGGVRTSPPVNIRDAVRSGSKAPQRSASAPIRVLQQVTADSKPEHPPSLQTSHSVPDPQFSPFHLFSETKKDDSRMNFASVVAGSTVPINSQMNQHLFTNADMSVNIPSDLSMNVGSGLTHQAKAPGYKPANLYNSTPLSYSYTEPSNSDGITSVFKQSQVNHHITQASQQPMHPALNQTVNQQISVPISHPLSQITPQYSSMMPQVAQMSQLAHHITPQQVSHMTPNMPPHGPPSHYPQPQMPSHMSHFSQVMSHIPLSGQTQDDSTLAKAPGFRSSMSTSISPRSSGSLSGGASPRNQLSDPAFLAKVLSDGKEEYATPNCPMTLPKIGSQLNPNAPDFLLRKNNSSNNGQPSPSPTPPNLAYPENMQFGVVSTQSSSLNIQQHYYQQLNSHLANQASVMDQQPQPPGLLLQQKLLAQVNQQAHQLYQALQPMSSSSPAHMPSNMPDADLAVNGPLAGMPTPSDSFAASLDDRKTMQPIGSGRSQRKGISVPPNVGFWSYTSDMNDWPIAPSISTMAHASTNVMITSVVMTSTVMTPSVSSHTEVPQVTGVVGFPDLNAALDEQFQNPVMLMSHVYNAGQFNADRAMFDVQSVNDRNMWNTSMKTAPVAPDPNITGWTNWNQQGNI